MAEGFNDKTLHENTKNQSEGDNSDNEDSMRLDLGIENIRSVEKKSQNVEKGSCEVPKREENPFSLRHFLNRNSSYDNYQHQGARPKIYSAHSISTVENSHGTNTENHQPRISSEFSSALPDFVQDHLVIEQCYLGNDVSPQEITVDLNNLPDFTPNKSDPNRWKDNVRPRMTDRRNTNAPPNLPLDLPNRPRVEFPLDLPLTESQATGSRSCPQTAEVGVSKSLPDFLSDGAVFQPEDNQACQSPERETDRLRRELEVCRRQLGEALRRADYLQRQIDANKDREHEYTQNLAKALEQVEENLNISNRRAVTAENSVLKLKQEINKLTVEIGQLQKENRSLRGDEGAVGGPSYVPNLDVQAHVFAQELRSAATTAEQSLRKLLSGVDNLRMMASSLENMYRIEERTDSYMSDYNEDTGPAL